MYIYGRFIWSTSVRIKKLFHWLIPLFGYVYILISFVSFLQVRDFTRNPRDIQLALDDNLDPPYIDTCDMGSVFDQM